MSDCKERKGKNFMRYNLITKFYCAEVEDVAEIANRGFSAEHNERKAAS